MYALFLNFLLRFYPHTFQRQFGFDITEDAREGAEHTATSTKFFFLCNMFFGIFPAHRFAMMNAPGPSEDELVDWECLGREIKQHLPRLLFLMTVLFLGCTLSGLFFYDMRQYTFFGVGLFFVVLAARKIQHNYERYVLGENPLNQVTVNLLLVVVAGYSTAFMSSGFHYLTKMADKAGQSGLLPPGYAYQAMTLYLAYLLVVGVVFFLTLSVSSALPVHRVKLKSWVHAVVFLVAAFSLWTLGWTPLVEAERHWEQVVNGLTLVGVLLLCDRVIFFVLQKTIHSSCVDIFDRHHMFVGLIAFPIFMAALAGLSYDISMSAKNIPYFGVARTEVSLYDLAKNYDHKVIDPLRKRKSDQEMWSGVDELNEERHTWAKGKLWHTFISPPKILVTKKRYCFAKNADKDDTIFCLKEPEGFVPRPK